MKVLTVIMSVYNEPVRYLEEAIGSILNQSFGDFTFIIILDNPSNIEALSYIKKVMLNDKRVKLIENSSNFGLTKSLNKALEYSKTEYIARMDADDIADKCRFEKQLDYLKNNKLDIVGSSIRRVSENGQIINKITNKSYPPNCIMELLKYDNCVPHPTWLAKRVVYEQLVAYRDIKACEDYDFLLRAMAKGFKIGICDEILLSYRVNTSGISRNNSLRQFLSAEYLQKNMCRIDDVTPEEVEKYLSKVLSEKKAVRYEKGLTALNDGIERIKNGEISGYIRIGESVFYSIYILKNIDRIFKMWNIKNSIK